MKTHGAKAIAVSIALVAASATSSQAALISRALVSGTGSDVAGCGAAPASPCRTFQYVVTNIIAPGGEIDVMGTAGYGPVTITASLSIVNDGAGVAGIGGVANGNSITISAGANDRIFLKGLTADGVGIGYNGVAFNSGGSLIIEKCVFKNFIFSGSGNNSGNGILLQPTSGAVNSSITNTITSNNATAGVSYYPTSGSAAVLSSIDHLISTGNKTGIFVSSGLATGGSTAVTISKSLSSANNVGLWVQQGSGSVITNVDDSNLSSNIAGAGTGIYLASGAQLYISRSLIVGNGNGIFINDFLTGYSYGDNHIASNGFDIVGNLDEALARTR